MLSTPLHFLSLSDFPKWVTHRLRSLRLILSPEQRSGLGSDPHKVLVRLTKGSIRRVSGISS
jgi:hypothetical protein